MASLLRSTAQSQPRPGARQARQPTEKMEKQVDGKKGKKRPGGLVRQSQVSLHEAPRPAFASLLVHGYIMSAQISRTVLSSSSPLT